MHWKILTYLHLIQTLELVALSLYPMYIKAKKYTCITIILSSMAKPFIISIETVKVTSPQHRFYFDIHKVCGIFRQGKFALGGQ